MSNKIRVKIPKDIFDYLKTKMNLVKDKTHGVYFLKFNNEVVYVGKSKNISKRINSHLGSKTKLFNDFSFIDCPVELLSETETAYIYKHDPIFNKKDALTEGMGLKEYCDKNHIEYFTPVAKERSSDISKHFDIPIQTVNNWKNSKGTWRHNLYTYLVKRFHIEKLEGIQ